jgi:type II secretory ATPase GspE/PulE/Tfp pilus assembly ATPase PilB-like protein
MNTVETGKTNGTSALLNALPNELLSAVVQAAVGEGATDIHVDTWGNEATVRFRVDGMLHEKYKLPIADARRLINQLRVSAELDVEATVKPVEGQFRWSNGEATRDIRVTVLPTAPRNEAAHLRLLTTREDLRDAEHLGLSAEERRAIEAVLNETHGLALIAGPTGSGKTTTLYALTGLEDLVHRVAVSIEDPAEYDLPNVRQMDVNPRRGITMQEGLRILLRVDPDVLIVGEIRDPHSAAAAAQAALTGRQVLATIHARDAAAAIHAMHYFSVPYYILGGALRLVIAQNLVRRLCRACAEPRSISAAEARLFEKASVAPPDEIFDPRGCASCSGYGYRGRTGVFEIALLDDDFGLWLADGRAQHEIRRRLDEMGVKSVTTRALEKVATGETSLREVTRLFWSALGDRNELSVGADSENSR